MPAIARRSSTGKAGGRSRYVEYEKAPFSRSWLNSVGSPSIVASQT